MNENKYSFFALVSRMKYITRWSLMRNNTIENVGEHSDMVAVIAHALAVIRNDVFGRKIDTGAVVSLAILHDSSEIFTGDMPTPVKYYDPAIMDAYKKVESIASHKLLTALPSELRPAYKKILSPDVNGDVYNMVKAADKLAAYIKCVEEVKSGNFEFRKAAEECRRKLDLPEIPEVGFFIENFLPAFELSLDDLDFSMD